ncbi:putative c6 transcription [Diplodia seriata]|uniref:Putative c6 transcription n=1 Tax=Diplodia seriata TaxID=420778 RepID=A0A0G2DS71_9PEZI|nr:putative c6 transcription [Diplodia seriata]
MATTTLALARSSSLTEEIHDQTSRLPLPKLLTAYSCLAAIYFISSLDINAAANALPAISRSLNAGTSITWAGASYLMGQTAFQPLYGRISDILGRKPVLLACIACLVVGDVLCGSARSAPWLYACRALAGVGGGGISSLVQITVSDLVSLRDRGKYQGLLSGAIGLGSSAGPFLAAGLIPINSGGSTWPWNSALVVSMLVVGAASLAVFVVVEKRFAALPMIPPRLFARRATTVIYLQSALYNCVWQVDMYFLPVYFQDVRGFAPLKSATLILPLLLLQSVAGVLSGPLMTKLARYAPVLHTGMALWLLGAILKLLLFTRTTRTSVVVTSLIIEGTGIGFVLQPALVALQSLTLPPTDRAVATSTRNLLRALGSVVGVALATAVQFAVMRGALPDALPRAAREGVLDGSWQAPAPSGGGGGDADWVVDAVLDAKMKGSGMSALSKYFHQACGASIKL